MQDRVKVHQQALKPLKKVRKEREGGSYLVKEKGIGLGPEQGGF
jgi:hypothetical protein